MALLASILVTILACGGDGGSNDQSVGGGGVVKLRLGFFPNITHSQAIVGVQRGAFETALADSASIETTTFNAGPAAIEALFAGAIDATYIGPNPAINGYVQSGGEALRIVAGATSGGALLIVRPEAGIEQPSDLSNKKIATPQLGNTQDVALRNYLLDNDLGAQESGGNVQVIPSANADTLNLFKQGDIDGAWVPEPWATRLVQEAGGEVFLDERDLWPEGMFVTTHLVFSTDFLEEHPDIVRKFVGAHLETTQWINDNPDEAKQLVNKGIEEATGAGIPEAVINAAWGNMDVTYDPLASSLFASAAAAKELGFIDDDNLEGIYSIEVLNQLLSESGLAAVKAR
jgi:NitT/TauT family transport system substrate-binding protein